MSSPPDIQAAVDTGDRLSFAVFIAAALHGMFIFGLGFSGMGQPPAPTTFEVTLATHKSLKAPDDAEYQAQFNQEASGIDEQNRELSSDTLAPFADTQVNEVHPFPETQAREAQQASELSQLHTEADSRLKVSRQENPEQEESQEHQEGQERELPLVNSEIASLRAKLDQQRQEMAKRPRIRRLTSVATVASAEAEYLHGWQQKVETVGNQNFPKEALQQGIFGQLRLATTVRANGTVVNVEILQSSGHSILDNAALQIVRKASPYSPFPAEIRKDFDQLEIIRTWRFEITGLSTSASE